MARRPEGQGSGRDATRSVASRIRVRGAAASVSDQLAEQTLAIGVRVEGLDETAHEVVALRGRNAEGRAAGDDQHAVFPEPLGPGVRHRGRELLVLRFVRRRLDPPHQALFAAVAVADHERVILDDGRVRGRERLDLAPDRGDLVLRGEPLRPTDRLEHRCGDLRELACILRVVGRLHVFLRLGLCELVCDRAVDGDAARIHGDAVGRLDVLAVDEEDAGIAAGDLVAGVAVRATAGVSLTRSPGHLA